MMLTREQNEQLTRVGPGTPMGELLRRYWQPVAAASELTDEHPLKRVRLMGEDLVLFRAPPFPTLSDGRGGENQASPTPNTQYPTPAYGLVGEHCSHRAASLYYG